MRRILSRRWLARHFRPLALALAPLLGIASAQPERSFRVAFESSVAHPVAGDRIAATQMTSDGSVVSIPVARKQILVTRAGGMRAEPIAVDLARLTGTSAGELLLSLAEGPDGHLFVPVAWRTGAGGPRFGVLKFRVSGGAELIPLASDAWRIAISPQGEIYASGLDAAYFSGKTGECFTVRRYSAAGDLRGSLSPCPQPEGTSSSSLPRTQEAFNRLREEIHQGEVWASADRLFQTLPVSGVIREFSFAGQQLAEVRLERPRMDGFLATSMRKAFPLPGRRFLVVWLHRVSMADRIGGPVTASLHGSDGRLIAGPLRSSEMPASPVFATPDGKIVFTSISPDGKTRFYRRASLFVE